jgi:hypothetical protein
MPPVKPTKHLPASIRKRLGNLNVVIIDQSDQKGIPMEIGEEASFGLHDKALDSGLNTKPFELGRD